MVWATLAGLYLATHQHQISAESLHWSLRV